MMTNTDTNKISRLINSEIHCVNVNLRSRRLSNVTDCVRELRRLVRELTCRTEIDRVTGFITRTEVTVRELRS